jgi:hypothetical protein
LRQNYYEGSSVQIVDTGVGSCTLAWHATWHSTWHSAWGTTSSLVDAHHDGVVLGFKLLLFGFELFC